MRIVCALVCSILLATGLYVHADHHLISFTTRHQVKATETGWMDVSRTTQWSPEKTAVIVCDMWNRHWCDGANRRVAAMLPRMNTLLRSLREEGVLIVHAPSDTLEYYANTMQRKRAMSAPFHEAPSEIQGWCHLNPEEESALPIDDSDGGCDCSPSCEQGKAWSMQHPDIEIAPQDAISDNGQEIYNLLASRGIRNIVMMGVHTNMCVLGRSFGIRQMTYHGMNVVLVRDLTDTMYNPAMPPHVSHDEGTALVVRHIERYWCPSTTSDSLLKSLLPEPPRP